MSLVFFDSAARIIKSVFDWLQTGDQGKTATLIQDTFQSGIDKATTGGEGFTLVPGTSVLSVTVQGQGIAYDPNSNRIFISSSDTTLFNPANLTTTTNDGLGNFILTPKSSGCVNIPLTPSSLNYVWINYLSTTDVTAFTLNEITRAKIFYRLTDGYSISVTTVNTPPNSTSIFLGLVDLTTISSGIIPSSTISQVGRQYFNILPNIVPITTAQANRSDATVTYSPASTYVLETHIKAVGTGTVSATNPHGTSIEDLGVGVLDTVVGHRQLEHGTVQSSGNAAANAIIAGVPGIPYPSTSAMAASINIVDPGSDYLTIFQLLSTEFIIVNGSAFNVTDIFGAIPANANVFFTSLPSGTYNVYWDSVAKSFAVTTSDISSDVTKLWLLTITWTLNFGPSYNHLSSLIDRRRIGSTTHLLQRWFNNARPGSGLTAAAAGEMGFNLTSNLFEFWDGSTWQQPVTVGSFTTVPTGAVLPFGGAVSPSGFLLANGQAVSRTVYANLFAVISTVFGAGDGSTTFNVPNMINNVPIGAGSLAALGATIGSSSHTLTPTELPAATVTVGITDPGHNHSQNAHNHSASSSDGGHSHSITDQSHNHNDSATGTVGYVGQGNATIAGASPGNFLPAGNAAAMSSSSTGITGTNTGFASISTSVNNTTATNNSNTTGITASGTIAGGGAAHSIVQPSVGLNYIIKT